MAKTQQKTRRSFGRRAVSNTSLQLNNDNKEVEGNFNAMQAIATKPNPTSLDATQYKKENTDAFETVAQIRIDSHLFDSIKNAVESAIFGGNYSIESASHFIREALREHAEGAPLKVAHQNGQKKSLSIRLTAKLKAFWDTLPKGHRNNILERAIRTKFHSYQV